MPAGKFRKGLAALAAVLAAGVGLGAAQPADAATQSPTRPPAAIQTIPIDGNPIAVAVSPRTGEIYATTIGGVLVINGRTNTVTSFIGVGQDTTGDAVSPRTGEVYVANVYSDTVSVINGRTDTVTSTISVGGFPCGIAVSPQTGEVYVANYVTNSVSVISQPR
jgi:YVTN family beta-propeller protein